MNFLDKILDVSIADIENVFLRRTVLVLAIPFLWTIFIGVATFTSFKSSIEAVWDAVWFD